MKIWHAGILLILVLFVITPVVIAAPVATSSEKDPNELPELDMTGMDTDIELIEVDPEILMATNDWMILAHDNDGKKALIDDIDRFSLSDAERSDMKTAVNDLWDTYPTKFVHAGEKTIDVTVQSEGSEKTISVPIGHVIKIQFDREKIKQSAQGRQTSRAQMLASIKPSTKIVLTTNENETIKNITSLREKNAKQNPGSGSAASSGRSNEFSGSVNSFSGSSSFSSGFSSSSDFSKSSGFPSSTGKEKGTAENGLMAWAGNPGGEVGHPTNLPESEYSGHNGIMYWACKNQQCGDSFTKNAADTATEPDEWGPIPETCQINMVPFASVVFPALANEKWRELIHSCNHYYDPLVGDIGSGAAPVYVKKYAEMAKYNKTVANNDIEAAKQLGQASHFLTDVSLPTHTGYEFPQVLERIENYPRDTHSWYEFYLNDYWDNGADYKFPESQKTIKEVIQSDTEYYSFTDPEAATKHLARFSNSYSETLYYKIRNLPPVLKNNGKANASTGFYADVTVERITKNQVIAASRYTRGLVRYVRNDATKNIPIADFTVSPNPVCNTPYDVIFHEKTHLTQSGSYTYEWNFGDGYTRTSGDYDFTHPFASSGLYTVTYKTWNTVNGPQNPTVKTIDVYAGACPPSAIFYIYPQTSLEPYSFKFEDHSTDGTPTSWMWSFGDDSPGSSEQNPIHKFDSVRQYDVTLIASNQYGDSILTERVDIQRPNAFAILGYNKKTGYKPLTVTFTDKSSCWATSSEFDAGDGTPHYYNQTEIVHTYNESGTYNATLTVRNDLGTDSNTTEIIVTTPPFDKIGVFRNGTWYLDVLGNGNSGSSQIIWFGLSGDQAVAGDWNGDGKDEVGVYRNGEWYIDYNGNGIWDGVDESHLVWFGLAGDQAVSGDWNDDGKDEIGVYRNGSWYLDVLGNGNSGSSQIIWFGLPGDQAVAGDWNGDGKDEVGVYRDGAWYIDYNGNGIWDGVDASHQVWFGLSGDQAVSGDWNSDEIDEVGVYRDGAWYIDYNGNGIWDGVDESHLVWFGLAGDQAEAGKW